MAIVMFKDVSHRVCTFAYISQNSCDLLCDKWNRYNSRITLKCISCVHVCVCVILKKSRANTVFETGRKHSQRVGIQTQRTEEGQHGIHH